MGQLAKWRSKADAAVGPVALALRLWHQEQQALGIVLSARGASVKPFIVGFHVIVRVAVHNVNSCNNNNKNK